MLTHVYFLGGDRQRDGIDYGIECVSHEEAQLYCQKGNGCFASFEAMKEFHQQNQAPKKPKAKPKVKENEVSS